MCVGARSFDDGFGYPDEASTPPLNGNIRTLLHAYETPLPSIRIKENVHQHTFLNYRLLGLLAAPFSIRSYWGRLLMCRAREVIIISKDFPLPNGMRLLFWF